MRILIDESLPVKFASLLAEHDVEFSGRGTALSIAVEIEEDDARTSRVGKEVRAV